jgi:hypothetical protein
VLDRETAQWLGDLGVRDDRRYVLVDFENVRLEAIAELDREVFKLMVFVGANKRR